MLLTLGVSNPMVDITGGEFRPLYVTEDSPKQTVTDFTLDQLPVTNSQFFDFVREHPRWQKGKIPTLFTEAGYLSHWQQSSSHWQPSTATLNAPVTHVSWFAAQAYCRNQGKQLPTVAQWEYVAHASETQPNGGKEKGYNQRILDWYGRPSSSSPVDVGLSPANFWGVKDMHGVIWEWTEDFNSALVNGESRNDSTIDSKLFCGAGAAGSSDPSDYAAFMRFGFRSSLQAKFTLGTLGFRCAGIKNTKDNNHEQN